MLAWFCPVRILYVFSRYFDWTKFSRLLPPILNLLFFFNNLKIWRKKNKNQQTLKEVLEKKNAPKVNIFNIWQGSCLSEKNLKKADANVSQLHSYFKNNIFKNISDFSKIKNLSLTKESITCILFGLALVKYRTKTYFSLK